jgi:hypothetical protein
MTSVIYLTYDASGTTSNVNCGSDTSLDNMGISRYPQVTFECWARLYGLGAPDNSGGKIISKGQTDPLYIEDHPAGPLLCASKTGSTDKLSKIPFTPDSDWHHLACTYDNAAAAGSRFFRLWVDGVEGAYSVQQQGVSILSDAANNLKLGNNSANNNYAIDGDLAWVRITQTVLYTGTFTPPARCTIPTPDADTVGLWITEGTGNTTYNLGFATGDGTITDCTWGSDSCGGAGPWWQVV